ncbi:metalloproteinase inhibitor 3 [Sarcoptes scabiei]|nr:metalloproteinase inhibitor 3 [Sarcoptes scabiei]
MTPKLFLLPSIVFIIVLSQTLFQQSNACSCAKPKIPLRCKADFVAIVRVTNTHVKRWRHGRVTWRIYDYDLLFLLFDRYFLAGFKKYRHLWTFDSVDLCGVRLKIGQTYLIGAFYNPETDHLELNACTSLVRSITEWRFRKWRIYGQMRKCLQYGDFTSKSYAKLPLGNKLEVVGSK